MPWGFDVSRRSANWPSKAKGEVVGACITTNAHPGKWDGVGSSIRCHLPSFWIFSSQNEVFQSKIVTADNRLG